MFQNWYISPAAGFQQMNLHLPQSESMGRAEMPTQTTPYTYPQSSKTVSNMTSVPQTSQPSRRYIPGQYGVGYPQTTATHASPLRAIPNISGASDNYVYAFQYYIQHLKDGMEQPTLSTKLNIRHIRKLVSKVEIHMPKPDHYEDLNECRNRLHIEQMFLLQLHQKYDKLSQQHLGSSGVNFETSEQDYYKSEEILSQIRLLHEKIEESEYNVQSAIGKLQDHIDGLKRSLSPKPKDKVWDWLDHVPETSELV
jgi:hypothetical protein